MLSLPPTGDHHSSTVINEELLLVITDYKQNCVLFPASGSIMNLQDCVMYHVLYHVKYSRQGKSGAFQQGGRLPVTIIHHQLPFTKSHWNETWKPVRFKDKKVCHLVSIGWTCECSLKRQRWDNLQQTKEEDSAPVSAASLAHISGPAGVKTTESHWRTEEKKPSVVLLPAHTDCSP